MQDLLEEGQRKDKCDTRHPRLRNFDMWRCRYVSYSCVDDGKAHNRKKHSGSAFDEAE